MGLLDYFKPSRGKARPVGQKLEKRRTSERPPSGGKNLAVKAGIFLALVAITLAAFPRNPFYHYTVQVGDEWRGEAVEAPVDFTIYKSEERLEAERQSVRLRTPPIFEYEDDALAQVQARRDTLARQLERTFEAYTSYLRNRLRGRMEEAREDSLRYLTMRRNARLNVSPNEWEVLARSYAERVPGITLSTRTQPSGPRLDQQLLQFAWEQSERLNAVGVMDVPQDSVHTDQITVRDFDENQYWEPSKDSRFGLDEAYANVDERARELFPDSEEKVDLIGPKRRIDGVRVLGPTRPACLFGR